MMNQESSSSSSISIYGHVTTPWTAVETMGEGMNPQRHRELDETMDRLKVMLQQETQTYLPCDDYLAKIAAGTLTSSLSSTDKVCDSWRRKLCEWCYSVVDHFNFDREVVFFAMSFLDRTVALKMEQEETNCNSSSNNKTITQRHFQLLAVTCLYLSIKLHAEVVDGNGPRQKLRIGTYVDLSRGLFTVQDIERTELDIFQTLNFQVNPPTAIGFISLLLRLTPKWTTTTDSSNATYAKVMGAIFDLARYLSELAVCVSSMTFSNKTSITSFASILLAIDSLPPTLFFPGAVRLELLRLIQETTGLHRWDEDVRRVYHELQDLCPMLCQQRQESSSSSLLSSHQTAATAAVSTDHSSHDSWHDGKVSPVCVADALDERDAYSSSSPPCYDQSSPSIRRKRLHAETS